MTPGLHTLYSATLFLAVVFLMYWIHRRRRMSRRHSTALSTWLKQ